MDYEPKMADNITNASVPVFSGKKEDFCDCERMFIGSMKIKGLGLKLLEQRLQQTRLRQSYFMEGIADYTPTPQCQLTIGHGFKLSRGQRTMMVWQRGE